MLLLKGRADGGVWWQAFYLFIFFKFDDFMMCRSDAWRSVMVLIASLTWQLSVPTDPGVGPGPEEKFRQSAGLSAQQEALQSVLIVSVTSDLVKQWGRFVYSSFFL